MIHVCRIIRVCMISIQSSYHGSESDKYAVIYILCIDINQICYNNMQTWNKLAWEYSNNNYDALINQHSYRPKPYINEYSTTHAFALFGNHLIQCNNFVLSLLKRIQQCIRRGISWINNAKTVYS